MKKPKKKPSSIYFTINLPCGVCKANMGDTKIWQLVFAHDKAELVNKVLNGLINFKKCPYCGHSAHVLSPFLYVDLDILRAVFVPSIAYTDFVNKLEQQRLTRLATADLSEEKRNTFIKRIQKVSEYHEIATALKVETEEVEAQICDYEHYLSCLDLPADEKIERMIEYRTKYGGSLYFTEAEMDFAFQDALVNKLEQARKAKDSNKFQVLEELYKFFEEIYLDRKQVKSEADETKINNDKQQIQLPDFEFLNEFKLENPLSRLSSAYDEYGKTIIKEIASHSNQISNSKQENEESFDFEEIERHLINQREDARRSRSLEEEGLILLSLSQLYFEQDRLGHSLSCCERILTITEKTGNIVLRSLVSMQLGIVYLYMEKIDQARAYLSDAVNLSAILQDLETNAICLYYSSQLALERSNVIEAKLCLKTAIQLFKTLNNCRFTVSKEDRLYRCLEDLGRICSETGEFAQAKEYFLEAQKLCQGNSELETDIMANLGVCCLQESIAKEESLPRKLQSDLLEKHDLSDTGMLIQLVPGGEGVEYLEKALEIAPDDQRKISILNLLAGACILEHMYFPAIYYNSRIIEIIYHNDELELQPVHLGNLAALWLEAIQFHEESYKEEEVNSDEDKILFAEAIEDAWQKAIKFARDAVLLARKQSRQNELSQHLGRVACLTEMKGNYQEALECYREALRIIEGYRTSLAQETEKLYFQNLYTVYFARAARCVLRVMDRSNNLDNLAAEAFHYAESAKCRILLDLLENKSISSPLNVYQLKEDSLLSSDDFKESISSHAVGIDEIVRELDTDTAILEYSMIQHFAEETGFWALFILLPGKESIDAPHRINLEAVYETVSHFYSNVQELEQHLKSAENQDKESILKILNQQTSNYELTLANLGKLLLPEIIIEELYSRGIRRLVIVPESYLFDVPWAALKVSLEGQLIRVIGDETHSGFEITLAPSATTFVKAHQKRKNRTSTTTSERQDKVLLFGGSTPDLKKLSAFLEHKMKQVVSESTCALTHFTGNDATPSNLMMHLPNSDVVFFYGHAHYNSEEPLASYLVLSGEEVCVSEYRLEAQEIFSLTNSNQLSKCNLFVMASCHGLRLDHSQQWEARELLGFSSVMFQRGVTSLIGSLLPTTIASVCRIFPTFFECYLSGMPASRALQKAQLSLQASDTIFAHPYFWGNFYLMGDYDARILQK